MRHVIRVGLLIELTMVPLLTAGEPVTVATVNRTASNWALYTAHALGYFQTEGLDLTLEVAGSSTNLMKGLRDGSILIGHMASGNVIRAVNGGEDFFIAMGVNRPLFTLVTAPEIDSLGELRGKRVGVDNLRSGYVYLVRELLRKAGLGEQDYRVRDVGGVDARYRALLAGELDAALLSVPRDLQAVAQGYRVVSRVDASVDEYTGSVAVARRSWAESHREILVGYLRAYRRALDWLYNPAHEDAAVEILLEHLDIPDSMARDIYRGHILEYRWLVPDGQVSTSGLRTVALQMLPEGSTVESGQLERCVDLSYYEAAIRERRQ